MTTETRASLLNSYASRIDDLKRMDERKAKLLEEIREITSTILDDAPLTRLLTDTGVMVGNGNRLYFDPHMKHADMPLVVEQVRDVPFAFMVDDLLKEDTTDEQ